MTSVDISMYLIDKKRTVTYKTIIWKNQNYNMK